MMNRTYQVKSDNGLTINDVFKLEIISKKKFNLVQSVLLTDLGNTQLLLEVIYRTNATIRVIEQREKKNIIARKSCIISSTNHILAFAESRVYSKRIPFQMLSEIRECKKGIGKLILYHKLEIFKKVTEIGYTEGLHIFKKYSLYHNGNVICKINEIFPFKINKDATKFPKFI
jgi:chorismate-pyruvate lyase